MLLVDFLVLVLSVVLKVYPFILLFWMWAGIVWWMSAKM